MTQKGDAKFEEKLTLGSKNDIRNLVNSNGSSGKSENVHFDVSLLNCVPYVLSCPTCLLPHVLSCPTCLVPYVISCLMCLVPYVLSCPTCLVSYVASCLVLYEPFFLTYPIASITLK